MYTGSLNARLVDVFGKVCSSGKRNERPRGGSAQQAAAKPVSRRAYGHALDGERRHLWRAWWPAKPAMHASWRW